LSPYLHGVGAMTTTKSTYNVDFSSSHSLHPRKLVQKTGSDGFIV
jgi:hypothetical protein